MHSREFFGYENPSAYLCVNHGTNLAGSGGGIVYHYIYTPNRNIEDKICESDGVVIDTMSARSSYPEGKRMCENLACSYYSQYGLPIKIARLTQTIGSTISYHDSRVFAEFARCAIENKDIILHTKGETKRNYLYVTDAVTAILTILFHGENGKAYNVANENTYCSIYEMAQMVSEKIARNRIKVKIELEDESKFGYNPVMKMNLDTTQLKRWDGIRKLDWKKCMKDCVGE